MPEQPPENKLTHPCFPQPPDTAVRVWRYMDLGKLVWTLTNRKLWLSRIDLLRDPHEGSTPRLLALERDEWLREHGAGQIVGQLSQDNQNMRTRIYASCWHSGNAESEAMWRLYCPGGQGVAIQTTYQRLVDSIAHDAELYIGLVTYLHYETQSFPPGNFLYPIMHKRNSFAHEREVRLVKTCPGLWGPPATVGPPGITVDWEIEPLIEAIYVGPYAAAYYSEVVQTVVKQFAPNLEPRVRWSEMRAEPVY